MNKPATYTKILQAFSEHEVQYLLIGGIAVTLHGYPRMTFDIDFLLLMTPANLQTAYKSLSDLNYKPLLPVTLEQLSNLDLLEKWKSERNRKAVSFIGREGEPVVDILLDSPTDFVSAYTRRTTVKVPAWDNLELHLIGIDDLIEMKEHSGREVDLTDAEMLRTIKGRKLNDE